MTTQLNNEFTQLLNYLDQQNKTKKKKVTKKESNNTKQLIEESKIHSYIPGKTFENPPPKKSKGFDVSKFEAMMRAKLIEEYKKRQSYERPYVSVSELYTCIRSCYYARKNYPVNTKKLFRFSYLYLIQNVGNTIHDIVQKLYSFPESEKTIVSEKFKVKGRLDGISDNYLFEIKSIDVGKFKNQYIKEHYLQAIIYAYILNNEYNYKIHTITIVYVIRNLKKIVPFDLPIDNKLAESLLSRAPILLSSLETNQVPDPFGATKETCKYCLYLKKCKEDKCNELLQPFNRKKKKVKKEKIQISTKKEKQVNDKKSVFLL